jgi:hypothetical protein
MKIFLFALALALCISCNPKPNPETLCFDGKVGEYPLIMKVSGEKEIKGEVKYDISSSYMNILGTKSYDGSLSISEYNDKGVVTGEFEGSIDENGSFTGFWSNKLKDRPKLYFELLPMTSESYEAQRNQQSNIGISSEAKSGGLKGESYSGKYIYWIGDEDAPTGSITWNIIFSGEKFSYEGRGDGEWCVLETTGKGSLVADTVGKGVGTTTETFDGDENSSRTANCSYTFNFGPESVLVSQDSCHGQVWECYDVTLTDVTVFK